MEPSRAPDEWGWGMWLGREEDEEKKEEMVRGERGRKSWGRSEGGKPLGGVEEKGEGKGGGGGVWEREGWRRGDGEGMRG